AELHEASVLLGHDEVVARRGVGAGDRATWGTALVETHRAESASAVVLIYGRQQHTVPNLRKSTPTVNKLIAFIENTLPIFELGQVFDDHGMPRNPAVVAGIEWVPL